MTEPIKWYREVIDLPSSNQHLLKKIDEPKPLAIAAKHFLIPNLPFCLSFFVSELFSCLCVCVCVYVCTRAHARVCIEQSLRKKRAGSIKEKCGLQNVFQNCCDCISLSTYMDLNSLQSILACITRMRPDVVNRKDECV